jgi:hypothetical protein
MDGDANENCNSVFISTGKIASSEGNSFDRLKIAKRKNEEL